MHNKYGDYLASLLRVLQTSQCHSRHLDGTSTECHLPPQCHSCHLAGTPTECHLTLLSPGRHPTRVPPATLLSPRWRPNRLPPATSVPLLSPGLHPNRVPPTTPAPLSTPHSSLAAVDIASSASLPSLPATLSTVWSILDWCLRNRGRTTLP